MRLLLLLPVLQLSAVLCDVPTNTLDLNSGDLALKKIVVFRDRAEIKRILDVDLRKGVNELTIRSLPKSIQESSIRVDGRGDATIRDVQLKTESSPRHEDEENPKLKSLREEQRRLEGKRDELVDQKNVYTTRQKTLDLMLEKAADSLAENDNVEIAKTQMDSLFNLHYDKSLKIQSHLRDLSSKTAELQRKLNEVQSDISRQQSEESSQKTLRILLETGNASKAQLELTYHVNNAYWVPYYDVRVNKEQGSQNASMSLTYFGGIKQRSGEDWDNAKILLSTAQPAESITPPKLGTLRASLRKEEEPVVMYAYGAAGAPPPPPSSPRPMAARFKFAEPVESASFDAEAAEEFVMPTTTTDKQAFATTFTIPGRHNIPSGSDEHKVVVAQLSFDAALRTDCTPSKSTSVFVSARVLNNSTYPLLAGDASIFVDGAFSSKTEFAGAVTGERFDLPIGVDESVKVLYRPAREFHEKKAKKEETTQHEQRIQLKNTRWNDSVILTVHEHIPLSTDASVTVNVIAPESLEAATNRTNSLSVEPGARLDENNNLAWTIELAADEERELLVKWEVEAPVNKTVEYNEEL